MTFKTFSFDKRINSSVKACGYETPTPIQNLAIPLILRGHDLMGLAQTGTGKTAAFALPILQRLVSKDCSRSLPKVLVLAPTRELALQIDENFKSLSRNTGIRSTVAIGGVGMGSQIKNFNSSQVIVACPGRLLRLVARKAADLSAIDTLVLDEADRMLDMGFMPDIKRILAKLPARRQNLLFSATMPDSIRTLANRILVKPKTVKVDPSAPVSSIEHVFHKAESSEKDAFLRELIGKSDFQNMLIFTRTKHKAKRLSLRLSRSGYKATFLQGNMSQNQRERALNGFRDGEFPIMVATDIAARGIDCDRITHVINYDIPDTVETYTHRIGRTGRAGRSGMAISLFAQDDISLVRAIQRAMKVAVEGPQPSDAAPPRKRDGRNTKRDGRNTPRARSNDGNKPFRKKRNNNKRRQRAA